MRVGIMQPYFFPYIGYFQLMTAVDKWVVFDQVQFIDKGWVNRNRILHPDPVKEWQFITLPLDKRGQFDYICDISVKEKIDWRAQILGKLTSYKKKAPYYHETIDFVRDCFDTGETNLARLVTEILRKTAGYLNITVPIEVQSEMNLQLGAIQHPGQWALRISKELAATEYINPQSGAAIFNPSEFDDASITLRFLRPNVKPYSQRINSFVSGLSIIDVLMFNNIEQCASLMEGYEVV